MVVPVTVAICAICLCCLIYHRSKQRKLGLLVSKGSMGSMDSDSSGRLSLDQKDAWLTAVVREPSLLSFTNGLETRHALSFSDRLHCQYLFLMLPEGLLTSGTQCRLSSSEGELPWSDWEARPEEFEVMRRNNGTLWELGRGNFGVRATQLCD